MEIAHTLQTWEKEIAEARGQGIKSFLRIGRALAAIKTGNLWQSTQTDSFEKYVEMAHGIKRSWAYSLMDVWLEYGELLIAAPALKPDITRLVKLLPLTTDDNKEDLVHMASEVIDVKGFENNLRNLRGKKATDECPGHQFVQINLEQCSICGLKRRI